MAKFEKTMPAEKKMTNVPSEQGHDVGKMGYRKMEFGGNEPENHLIRDAYVKQARPMESEDTDIHNIAHQQQTSQFYSGDRHDKKNPSKKSTTKMSQGNENG